MPIASKPRPGKPGWPPRSTGAPPGAPADPLAAKRARAWRTSWVAMPRPPVPGRDRDREDPGVGRELPATADRRKWSLSRKRSRKGASPRGAALGATPPATAGRSAGKTRPATAAATRTARRRSPPPSPPPPPPSARPAPHRSRGERPPGSSRCGGRFFEDVEQALAETVREDRGAAAQDPPACAA